VARSDNSNFRKKDFEARRQNARFKVPSSSLSTLIMALLEWLPVYTASGGMDRFFLLFDFSEK
jgi:hypothetical protein